jgi:tetratricopeptide (TPR) repeat protein
MNRLAPILPLMVLAILSLASSCDGGVFKVEPFTPVIRQHPSQADEWFNSGTAYLILEREDEAAKALEEAVRLNPNDNEARFELGVAYSILDREDEAAAAFRSALSAGFPATQHFKLGLAYSTLGRHEEAARELEQAISAGEPHPITNRVRLGLSYNALGRYKDAAKVFEDAIRLNHQVAVSYYNAPFYLGVSFQLGGKFREAAAAYREALSVRPDFVEGWFNLGVVCLSLGDAAGAREQVEALRGLNPEAAKTLEGYLHSQGGKQR